MQQVQVSQLRKNDDQKVEKYFRTHEEFDLKQFGFDEGTTASIFKYCNDKKKKRFCISINLDVCKFGEFSFKVRKNCFHNNKCLMIQQ